MKTLKYMLAFLFAALLFTACSQEDLPEVPQNTGTGNIHFRVGGSAAIPATRAGEPIPAEANERHIENLYALLWDVDKGYYGYVEAIPEGNQGDYTINVQKDGEYWMLLIANPDEDLLKSFDTLEEGAGKEFNYQDRVAQIATLIGTQDPDAQYPLMASYTSVGINVSLSAGSTNVDVVPMERLNARFDIINQADGVTVKKVVFNNRAIKTNIRIGSEWNKDSEWFDSKVYDDLSVEGNSEVEKAGTLRHEIYSYRNYSSEAASETRPSITIVYEQVENGQTVTREHTVNFIDPNASGSTPLAIKHNTLYTITLKKAQKLEFELSVNDWENVDDISVSDLSVNDLLIPSDEQQRLNSQLKVNMFTDYHVKSLNLTTKEVELFDHLSCDKDDYSNSENGSYFSYNSLKSAGLVSSDASSIITDKEGNKYRVPTAGELGLIFPVRNSNISDNIETVLGTNSDGTNFVMEENMPVEVLRYKEGEYTAAVPEKRLRKFADIISFKNSSDNYPEVLTYPCDENDGISSSIEWVRSFSDLKVRYREKYIFCKPSSEIPAYKYAPIFAVRFKGTKEYAAYKYEYITAGEEDKVYASIKIKAIPAKLDISVFDIVDNDLYWSTDYIEIKYPCVGRYEGNNYVWGLSASSISRTLVPYGDKKDLVFVGAFTNTVITTCGTGSTSKNNAKYPLRLVKVEEASASARRK